MRNARKRRLKRRTHVVKTKRPWATIKRKEKPDAKQTDAAGA